MPELDPMPGTVDTDAESAHARQIARLDAVEARLRASITHESPEPAEPAEGAAPRRRRWPARER